MLFEPHKSLYSDTPLPDIFITEYMPSMDGDYIKVYAYCLFLSKYNKQASTEELSKKLEIDEDKVKNALTYLESIGVISRSKDGIELTDLKEKEIRKIYRLKTTSSPDEALQSSERNKKRNSIITAINNTFFQGVMSASWYTDIDSWFDRYKFDEDVMYALFQHCYSHKGLAKQYIVKVADSWYSKNIKNYFDLEKYLDEYQKFKDIRGAIVKKLKLNRNLTEYEEEYVEKWVLDYKFSFDIIELALKRTTAKTSPSMKYIHTAITDWYGKGLRDKNSIIAYIENQKQANGKSQPKEQAVPQHGNYKQREYSKEYFESLYYNAGK